MLTWYEALGYGALGGLIVELISLWQQLQGWQEGRKAAMLASEPAPNLVGRFIDPVADGAVAVTRVLLGCGAGFIIERGAHRRLCGGGRGGIGPGPPGPSRSVSHSSARHSVTRRQDEGRRMSRSSFARRYLDSLTGNRPLTASSAVTRAPADYGFWWRYWASFTGISLVRVHPAAARRPAARPSGRTMSRLPHSASGWSLLPRLPEPAHLVAGSDDDTITRTALSEHGLEVHVHAPRQSRTTYRAELVLRDPQTRPSIVRIRYAARLLLVPLVPASFGPPTALVYLPDLAAGDTWEISDPFEVDPTTTWEPEIVEASVVVAANEASRQAWRAIARQVSPDTAALIDQALR